MKVIIIRGGEHDDNKGSRKNAENNKKPFSMM
jgi:hypothetical protein